MMFQPYLYIIYLLQSLGMQHRIFPKHGGSNAFGRKIEAKSPSAINSLPKNSRHNNPKYVTVCVHCGTALVE